MVSSLNSSTSWVRACILLVLPGPEDMLHHSGCCVGVQRSSGWRFPWAVRVRVADLLLRGLFESDDSGAYVEDRTALLSLLENQLWPLLGISPQVNILLA